MGVQALNGVQSPKKKQTKKSLIFEFGRINDIDSDARNHSLRGVGLFLPRFWNFLFAGSEKSLPE